MLKNDQQNDFQKYIIQRNTPIIECSKLDDEYNNYQ